MAVPNIVIQEQTGSRTYSYDTGKVTASRTFFVWDTANTTFGSSGLQSPYDIKLLFGTSSTGVPFVTGQEEWVLPDMGDLFPDETGIYAQSYNITREAGADHWTVVWTYKNTEVTTGPQPNEPGYVEWTLDISASFVDTWVLEPRYPTNGTVSTTEGANIIAGGTQIDIEGVPVSAMRLTTDILISETVESTGGPPAIYANARVARGRRNNAAWYGIEIGKAVYIGCNVRRVGVNLYTVQHRIQEASDFHLIQYPDRDSTGKIPTEPKNGKDRAKLVYWRQPFPTFANFDAISGNW